MIFICSFTKMLYEEWLKEFLSSMNIFYQYYKCTCEKKFITNFKLICYELLAIVQNVTSSLKELIIFFHISLMVTQRNIILLTQYFLFFLYPLNVSSLLLLAFPFLHPPLFSSLLIDLRVSFPHLN